MELNRPKGRQVHPDTLSKYERIKEILLERPNTFSKRELCLKHQVNYHNFCQWVRNKEPKGVSLKQPSVFITDKSLIITTAESLTALIKDQIRESVKVALYEGVKSNKIKLLKL